MKLWFIFELFLFFVLLAFASARSVGKQEVVEGPLIVAETTSDADITTMTPVAPVVAEVVQEAVENITDPNSPSRFCKCVKLECNCCRDFRLPVLPISSAGCATLKYLKGDKMSLTMKLGNAVLRNVTISGRKAKPACVNLPGGFSQFCGRVYGISRQDETFRACLGLELRALADLEASLRVSCFRFSPTGVTMEPAPPLPPSPVEEDDDDDFFGFGGFGGDDEDDEDDDDEGIFGDDDEEYKDTDAVEAENDVSSDEGEGEDYPGLLGTFGSFFDTFFDETTDSGNKKKKKTPVKKVETASSSSASAVINDKIDLIVEEKPTKTEIVKKPESTTNKPNKIVATTERQPTTIVLSPTSSVTVTMSESTTKRVEIPDPVKQSSEETKEETEEDDEEEDDDEDDDDEDFDIELDDDDETTEKSDSESFSSELAEAIKGVEEELSSVGDIEVEDSSDEEDNEPTGKPSATIDVSSTTESDDEDLDILGAVEELAEEVSGTDKDEPPPQIGVAMNGEPRTNATKTKTDSPKRQKRSFINSFEETQDSGNKKKKKPPK